MGSTRVTQAEIAKRAGVSQAAVSQVLSDTAMTTSLASETCERILQVARELGYRRRRSTPARQAARKTKNIGFLIPAGHDSDHLMVYIRRLHAGVLEQLEKQGYHLIQAIIHPDEPLPAIITMGKVDGVIIEDKCPAEFVSRLQQVVPVALLNYHLEHVDVDSIMPDNAMGIWAAVSHLHALGHRRIALFGMEPEQIHHAERLASYRASLAKLGLSQCEEYLGVCEPQRYCDQDEVSEFAMATLQRWAALPHPPTGVVMFSDGYASFFLRAARQLGLDLPRQLSVVGFDNVPLCEHTDPRLSSIEQPMEEMGQLACQLMVERLTGMERPAQKLRVGVKLVERDSTAPPPPAAETIHTILQC